MGDVGDDVLRRVIDKDREEDEPAPEINSVNALVRRRAHEFVRMWLTPAGLLTELVVIFEANLDTAAFLGPAIINSP
jgi:hypothetical protein